MTKHRRVVAFGRGILAVAFVGLGVVGIVSSLSQTSSAVRSSRIGVGPDDLVSYVSERVRRFQVRLRSAPDDPDLHLRLARTYAERATVRACVEYDRAFPGALQDGRLGPEQYETWRRGWLRRDPDGDLRRARHHARRVLAAPTAPPVRRRARWLLDDIAWHRGHGTRPTRGGADAPIAGGRWYPHYVVYPRGDALPMITVRGRSLAAEGRN